MAIGGALVRGLSKAAKYGDEVIEGVARYGDEALDVVEAAPKRIPKQTVSVNRGVAQLKDEVTPSQAEFLVRRQRDLQNLDNRLMNNKELLEVYDELKGDPANLLKAAEEYPDLMQLIDKYGVDNSKKIRGRLTGRIEDADAAQSSQLSSVNEYTDENYRAFGTTRGKEAKTAEEIKRKVSGYLEQHHLLSKGVTGAFMEKADQLIASGKAQIEDLVAMGKYAEDVTNTAPGDRASNILNMQKEPHSTFHTEMELQGIEESKQAWRKDLEKVDTIEGLFEMWEEWIQNDGIYTKEAAEIWESMDGLLKEINPEYTGKAKPKRIQTKSKPKKKK